MKATMLLLVLLCMLSVGLSAPTAPLVYGLSTPLDYAAALGYGGAYNRPTTIYTGYSPYTYTYGYGYNYPYFLV